MKKISFVLLMLSVISCGEQSREKPSVENAIDNTDSSIKGSFGSYRNENIMKTDYDKFRSI